MSLPALAVLFIFVGIALAILVHWGLGVLCILVGLGIAVYLAFASRGRRTGV